MNIQAFGIHEQALQLRAMRNEVLTSNIANADTPNYKARDIDFGATLRQAEGAQLRLRTTSELHSQPSTTDRFGGELKYRVPTQPTLDGNTVETDVEQAAFAENAVKYRASLAFLNGTISSLRYALKGAD